MNDKMVFRAAAKYLSWMTQEANSVDKDSEEGVHDSIDNIRSESRDLDKWVGKFFTGTSARRQRCRWDKQDHIGLINCGVYKDIVETAIPAVGEDIVATITRIVAKMKLFGDKSAIKPLSAKEAINEIRAVNKSWKGVTFRDGVLKVPIHNVCLSDDNEEVELGSFAIALRLDNPISNGMYIYNLDGPESNGGYIHPHVSGNTLCTGDGQDLLRDAICQGRLEDYFTIVEAILRTYNDDSPHEALRAWCEEDHGGEFYCDQCEEWRCDEESCYCEGCNTDYCEHCFEGSGCNECNSLLCGECITSCNDCNETVCKECAVMCCGCNNDSCQSCLTQCSVCDESHCGSCNESCMNCADSVCDNCSKNCGCCNGIHCGSCLDEKCNKCGNEICSECQKSCGECSSIVCSDCHSNACEDCGVPMCESCKEGHSCILAEVNNE